MSGVPYCVPVPNEPTVPVLKSDSGPPNPQGKLKTYQNIGWSRDLKSVHSER